MNDELKRNDERRTMNDERLLRKRSIFIIHRSFLFVLAAFCLLPSAFAQNLPAAQIFNRVYLPTSLSLNANPGQNPNPLNCISNPKTLTTQEVLNCVYDPTNKALYLHLLDPVVPTVTVATLPSSPPAGTLRWVSNGASTTDCTAGLGSTRVLCAYSGSAWASAAVPVYSNGVIYASQLPGADMCAKVGAAWLQLVNAGYTGGTVDARGFTGTQNVTSSCFTNFPYNSSGAVNNAFSGVLLTGAVKIVTTVSQVVPPGAIWDGGAPYALGGVMGASGTIVQQGAGFPASTPVIDYAATGTPSTAPEGAIVKNLGIVCATSGGTFSSTSIGIRNMFMQENSGWDHIHVIDCNTAFDVENSNAPAIGGALHAGPYTNMVGSFTSNVSGTGYVCLNYGYSTANPHSMIQSREFSGLTCIGSGASQGDVAIYINGADARFSDIHIEEFGIGVEIADKSTTYGISLNNIDGQGDSYTMASLVDISATGTTAGITLTNLAASDSKVTNLIADHQTNGYTVLRLAQPGTVLTSIASYMRDGGCVNTSLPNYPPVGCAVPAPTDWSNLYIQEEFMGGTSVSNQIGTHGWTIRQVVGSGATCAATNSENLPNPGIIACTSPALAGQGITLILEVGGYASIGDLESTSLPWTTGWIASISTISSVQFRLGYVVASTTPAVIPAHGFYLRYDTELKSLASATCNDAGNKCGLTTLTGTVGQTVYFKVNGGRATGHVALTGTNVIANGTAITVDAAGGGYNATGGAAVGTSVAGGTATYTGNVALTSTLGAAQSGPDTYWNFCYSASSVEYCYVTTVAPVANTFVRVKIANSGALKMVFTLYDNTGAQTVAPKTICAAATATCDAVTPAVLVAGSDAPAAQISSGASAAAVTETLDAFKLYVTGLAR